MDIQLANAYVELTSRGLDSVMVQADLIKTTLEEMVTAANRLNSALGSEEPGIKLRSLNEQIVGVGRSIKDVEKSAKDLNRQIAPGDTIQRVKNLKTEIDAAGKQASTAGGGAAEGSADKITRLKSEIEAMLSRTKETPGAVSKIGERFASLMGRVAPIVSKIGMVFGVVTLVAGAAKAAYDFVTGWAKSATGFNEKLQRSVELSKQVADSQRRITRDAIKDTEKLASVEERRLALQKSLDAARRNEADQKTNLRKAESASNVGWLGGLFDGKWQEELESDLQSAQAVADASTDSVRMLQQALESLNDSAAAGQDQVRKDLEQQIMLHEKGISAVRREELERKGFSKLEAQRITEREELLKLAVQEKQKAEQITEQYKQQLKALNLQYEAQMAGEAAAARMEDRLTGFDSDQQKELASIRKKIQLLKDQQDLEEKDRNRSEAFKDELKVLKLQRIELEKGAEAAQQERDRQRGFSEEQIAQLAFARQGNELLAKQQDSQGGSSKSPQLVGIAQLAEQMQAAAIDKMSQQRQLEASQAAAKATEQLVGVATGSGIKISSQTPKAPEVNYQFGQSG